MRFGGPSWSGLLPVFACGALVVIAGCGRRIRAVDAADQIVSNKHRTATVNTPQFEVSATWTPVPWAGRHGPTGFLLQIANIGDCAVDFDLDGVKLEDGFGRVRGAIPPDKLWRAFSRSSASRPRRAALVSHRRYIRYGRHYHRRYYYDSRPRYRVYTSFGGWGRGWGPYDYDSYYEQRKTARFLAQLLESQTIPPQGVATGYVVFPYDPEEDDELTLRIEIGRPPGATTTRPAVAPTTVSMVFEVK